MSKIKIIFSVFLVGIVFSLFSSVHFANATSCSAQISGDIFSWNVSGSFTSAKLSCPATNNYASIDADITDYLKTQPQGSVSGYANNASLLSGCSLVLNNNVSCAITTGGTAVSSSSSDATCSLNFTSSSVEKGEDATIAWSSSGSFDSAKLVCSLAGSTDVTNTLKSVPSGSLSNWQENSTGNEVCKIYFNNNTTPACASNTLMVNSASITSGTANCDSTCAGNVCWNGTQYASGTKTTDCATVSSFSASPNPLKANQTTAITWTSSATKMEAECTGLIPIARGSMVTNSASSWETGYSASFGGKAGSETCTLYPYDSNGNVGIPKSITINIEKACECNGAFSGGNDCSSGQTCDGCHCVASTTGTTTSATACGSQAGQIVSYGSLNSSSANLCSSGSAVTGFRQWCGLYDWHCGSSTVWCNAYIQGSCGSVSGTTVSKGVLTKDSANLCKNTKPSYFTDNGSSYTWKCGKDSCGDERSEKDGVVDCSATESGGTSNCECNGAFSGGYGCSSGQTCDGCHCVASGTNGGTSTYSCTGTLPTGATMCDGDSTGLATSLGWQSIGTSVSSCTTSRKCEYYTSNSTKTCVANCSGSDLTCQTTQPANSTKSTSGSCCDEKSCYQCPAGYFWNTTNCSKLSDICDLSATLSASPESGSSPLMVDIKSNISAAHGPIYCDNQDCNGGTVSNIDNTTTHGCDFTCTYNSSGTYKPKVHIANSACAKDPAVTVTVSSSGSSSACASQTCTGNSCWDGTKYIQGTKTEGCATCSVSANPQTITPSDISYLTWTTSNTSKMDVFCSGLVDIKKGSFNYLTDNAWYEASKSWYAKPTGAPDGYPMGGKAWFNTNGTESCIFYPYNNTDSKEGTPCGVTITINKDASLKTDGECGTAAKTYASTATTWGSTDTFCTKGTANPTNPTFPTSSKSVNWICQGTNGGADTTCNAKLSTQSSAESQNPSYICQPDDSNCVKTTCKGAYCNNGCALVPGEKECK
jgi:hypothetical protein